MVMSGLAVGVIALMGYVWLTRGFFSALIHLVCTVIAGAVAFGVWEHVSLAIMNFAPQSGLLSFLSGTAWALGLALPFAVTLAVLRIGIDSLIRANASAGDIGNAAGGGVCGALAGVITSGILVISLGFLRMEPTFFGAQHVAYAQRGYVVRTGDNVSRLIVPTDAWTVRFYGMLSEAVFRTPSGLAAKHPYLEELPASMRMNAFEGKSRNTTRPDDFAVTARFTVGQGANLSSSDLLSDSWNSAPQDAKDLDDKPFPNGSYIEGFIIRFQAGAKEKDGKVAVGAGQIRLVLQNTTDVTDRIVAHPIAAASQAEATTIAAGRWRFDAPDTYIASVGGASEANIGFEFVVPPGYEPTYLYVKGIRHDVSQGTTATPSMKFANTRERDAFIAKIAGGDGALPTQVTAGGSSGPVTIGNGVPTPEGQFQEIPGIKVTNRLPFTLQDGTLSTLEITSEGEKQVVGGSEKLKLDYKQNTQGLEKSLRIETFQVSSDTNLVQLQIDTTSPTSILGVMNSITDAGGPVLVDTNNQVYQPIGFVYEDEQMVEIRYTPSQPLRTLAELPTLSKSRPAQRLTLLFRVSFGAQVQRFNLGSTPVAIYNPPVRCDQKQSKN
jgi:hypothetical protein